MSESDCAQMRIKLRHFSAWQARRAQIAEYYRTQLDGPLTMIPTAEGIVHANHKFVFHYSNRAELQKMLAEKGIETKVHYPVPLHTTEFAHAPGMLDGAEDFSRTCLSLPIYPELTDNEVEYIVDTIKTCTW
jgi:dTDP-4-amino-4,6-dideoxygalactose transaminase